jgi:hypothetical protein
MSENTNTAAPREEEGAPPFCHTPGLREEEVPVIQARLSAGIGCGGIREEEDATA